jgi:hypothetical protein
MYLYFILGIFLISGIIFSFYIIIIKIIVVVILI